MLTKHVPFVRLSPPNIKRFLEITNVVMKRGRFILDDQVEKFEQEFAEYIGTKYCVGVGNGFDALRLCIYATGLESHIALPANAPLPVWQAADTWGLNIIPCDPFLETYQMNFGAYKPREDYKHKHAIVVHLYGMPADMDEAQRFVGTTGTLIEDCCQAHGAGYKGKKVGTFGMASAFSFYPTKNLGCFGDGGAVCTNSEYIANRVKMAREYGRGEGWGINSRLDELQAAYLREGLRTLDDENKSRRTKVSLYAQRLSGMEEVILPNPGDFIPNIVPVWHQLVVRCADRHELRIHLFENGIETMIHYPTPCYKMPAFDYYSGYFPNADKLSREVLSLPIGKGITEDDVEYVAGKIKEFYAR